MMIQSDNLIRLIISFDSSSVDRKLCQLDLRIITVPGHYWYSLWTNIHINFDRGGVTLSLWGSQDAITTALV
eukprot:scaffold2649_cov100-Skeletonema_dohrnii-CCMP3373.AAC.8